MPQKTRPKRALRPPQHQRRQPGLEARMRPRPRAEPRFGPAGRLAGRVALVTGGDSGIGRAVSLAFAREGADVGVVYLNEHRDARDTVRAIEAEGRRAIRVAGDVGREAFCRAAVRRVVGALGRLDVLVNNAAVQFPQARLGGVSARQLERTFRTNVFSYFYMAKAALPHLRRGSAIVNTTSAHGVPGEPAPDRLRRHQGRDRRVHAVAVAGPRPARHPRQRGRARPDLDTADPGVLPAAAGRDLRLGRTARPRRRAERGGALLRPPGLGGRLVHDGPGPPSERRRDRQRLTALSSGA
jgi:hypothetical protein